MSPTPPADPLRYDPTVETRPPDEEETVGQIGETLRQILETTSRDYGHAVRSVHAKGHGIVRGTLSVADGLPPALAQGLFAVPGEHPAILRFSTNPGDILDDSISVPRGLAIKVLGVAGERLPGSEQDSTQDFVMVNGPAFFAPDPKQFLAGLKLLAKTTDRAEGLKKAFSATLQAVEGALETVGVKSATLQTLGGAPNSHPLGETYYSQTPFRYGAYLAKFAVAPVSLVLKDLTGSPIHAAGRPDALREDINEVIGESGGDWEFRVQLCTDPDEMPIEDASQVWDEKASPYIAVARLHVPPQVAWEHGTSDRTEAALAFSPWHGLAAHQPLGGVNRARRPTYRMSSRYRADFNHVPIREPEQIDDLPG